MTKPTASIKLLLIDDNPEDRLFYARLLEKSSFPNCTVLESETGEEGLDRCLVENPDCVLVDYMLPDIDGVDFISRLQAVSFPGALVMVTGQGDERVAVKAIKEGADDYIVKDALSSEHLQGTLARAMKFKKLKAAKKKAEEKLKEYAAKLKESGFQKDRLIQELKKLQKDLEVSAMTDPLTGLYNRRVVQEKLEYEKIRFERSRNPFSLILADIDHFKRINDTHGHLVGDQVLVHIAAILKKIARKQDVICRWGGEEFIIFLPETHLEGGIVLANKLRMGIESQPLVHNGDAIAATMSFGISTYNNDRVSLENCIKEADECLYQAKQKGRNSISYVANVSKILAGRH